MNAPLIMPASMHAGRIALGCVTFGREIDEASAITLLDHALARGVAMFDTASAYGQGASESIIGRWIASRRPAPGSLTIATKILPPYEPRRIAESVRESLQRLQLPAIDLLYLHRWDATAEEPPALAALEELVRSGSVRALGVSNFNQQQLATAIVFQRRHGWTPFTVLQNNHNLAVSDVSPSYRDFCAANGIAIVTYSPLGAGFLTGKHRRGVEPGSRFDVVPGHKDVYFHDQSWQRLDRLEAIAAHTGHSQAHLALAWALHQPGIASVLIGGRTPAHLNQAFAALAFDAPDLFAELTEDRPASFTYEGPHDRFRMP
jgi:aryl-alcohol dehydrogenase-like predicted oxidoreductase